MANLLSESSILSSRFVFYKRLQQDGETRPELERLYQNIITKGNSVVGANDLSARADKIASTLRAQATVEAQKEAQLLNEKFRCNVDVGKMLTKDVGKQITLLMNDALQLQDIFKRNVTRIVGDDKHAPATKTTITQVFWSYFVTALSQSWATIEGHIGKILSQNPGLSISDAIDQEFQSTYIMNLMGRALDKALDSATWQNDSDSPFKELSEYLEKHDNRRNELIRSMWDNLGIDKLRESLKKEIKNEEDFRAYRKKPRGKDSKLETTIKSGMNKGIVAEVFSKVVAESAIERKGEDYQFDFSATRTGGYQVKPDVVMTFDIDINEVIQRFEKYTGVGRDINVQRAEDINEFLERLDKGFIVYSNVKDWSLDGKNNKFEGFSAGQAITLRKYETIMNGLRAEEFIGAVANTIEGAVFDAQRYRDALTDFLAQDIGAFLFDDIRIIGKNQNGAKSLHLLNLNGVYIPLSYLMLLLAEAFEAAQKNHYKDIVNPKIMRKHGILYPTGGEGHEGEEKWSYQDWINQRNDALDSITISMKFAKNLVEIVEELMR